MADDSPKWAARAQAYWRRQERRYGMKLGGYTLQVDHANRTVYTHTVVLEVLPGVRLRPWVYDKTDHAKRALVA